MRDELTDEAIENIEKALVLSPSESELYTLLGFSYLSKMNTGSTLRAIIYLPKAKQALNKAISSISLWPEQTPSSKLIIL
jgi:hypothetical protein